MYKFCLLIIGLGFFFGCATVSSIERNYKAIDFSDGVSRQEAKLIAKKHIIQTSSKNEYRVLNPQVYDAGEFLQETRNLVYQKAFYNNGQLQFPDSWYVVFRPKLLSLFSVYYLVIIDKDSGELQYSHDRNALAGLVELMLTDLQENVLQPAVVAISYYSENEHWPFDGEELADYFKKKLAQEGSQEGVSEIALENLQFEETPEGHLIIQKNSEDKVFLSSVSYEIKPSDNNEFILSLKENGGLKSYVLKNLNGKITVNSEEQNFKIDINFP